MMANEKYLYHRNGFEISLGSYLLYTPNCLVSEDIPPASMKRRFPRGIHVSSARNTNSRASVRTNRAIKITDKAWSCDGNTMNYAINTTRGNLVIIIIKPF